MCVCVMLVSRTYRDIAPSGDGSLEQSCVCVCVPTTSAAHTRKLEHREHRSSLLAPEGSFGWSFRRRQEGLFNKSRLINLLLMFIFNFAKQDAESVINHHCWCST